MTCHSCKTGKIFHNNLCNSCFEKLSNKIVEKIRLLKEKGYKYQATMLGFKLQKMYD